MDFWSKKEQLATAHIKKGKTTKKQKSSDSWAKAWPKGESQSAREKTQLESLI